MHTPSQKISQKPSSSTPLSNVLHYIREGVAYFTTPEKEQRRQQSILCIHKIDICEHISLYGRIPENRKESFLQHKDMWHEEIRQALHEFFVKRYASLSEELQ